MHFAIRYLSRYVYDGDVVDNINALRIRPATGSRQQVDDFTVRLTPEVRQHRHEDYYGTDVIEFEVTRPHRELVIDAHAHVTTEPQPEPPAADWLELAAPGYRELGAEFLMQTDEAAGHPLLAELEAGVGAAATPLDAVLLVSQLVPDRLEYRKGATYVDSTLADVLDVRAGVCQDFVHLGLNLLRSQGIAARYVSGYLYARDGRDGDGHAGDGHAGDDHAADGRPAEGGVGAASVEVDTHAWIEALLPDDGGEPRWVGVDPTNRGLVGECHVKIGHGRHYADVPPIKGVYRGSANSTLVASVTMTRTEPLR
ncbi:MAG: transglutaminase family protein [Acidobacteriota bacterium]|nr:transglutaminase family protein [Acidobacteriota bacterium]